MSQESLRVPAGVKPLSYGRMYQLGVDMSKQMDPCCTLRELAAELGVTHQTAYTESVLALGKLAWLMSQRLGVPVVALDRPCRRISS